MFPIFRATGDVAIPFHRDRPSARRREGRRNPAHLSDLAEHRRDDFGDPGQGGASSLCVVRRISTVLAYACNEAWARERN